MECTKCHREREQGQTYWFYYGKKIHSEESIDISKLVKIKRTSYFIPGQDSAWICDRCSNLSYSILLGTYLVLSPLFLMGLLVFAFGAPGDDPLSKVGGCLACCGLPWLVIGGVLLTQKGRMRTASGERFAIRARKKNLQDQGYDTFFTTAEYEGLEGQK